MKSTGKIFLFGVAAALASGIITQRVFNIRRWLNTRARTGPGTALITGASSGIGAEFARQLAREGYNLVLVARRRHRLEMIADEIKNEAARRGWAITIDMLPADLNSTAGIEQVERRIQSIPDFAMLVNNAGFGAGGTFSKVELQPELSMIQVHIVATMRLTHAALPILRARGHGAVINVSSLAGFLPSPHAVTYGASKSFLNSFTEGLQHELYGTGVRVQALCPGYTYTEFHDHIGFDRSRIPAFLWMDAGTVVKESLQALKEDRVVVIPGFIYKIIYTLVAGVPFRLTTSLVGPMVAWFRRLTH